VGTTRQAVRDERRERIERGLASLEAEYRDKLAVALRACAGGYWGLFGQNNDAVLPDRLRTEIYEKSGMDQLMSLAAEIEAFRKQLEISEPFPLHARLLAAQGNKGSNHPGEPKLARAWLDELEKQKP
jgi:hypothetical protein